MIPKETNKHSKSTKIIVVALIALFGIGIIYIINSGFLLINPGNNSQGIYDLGISTKSSNATVMQGSSTQTQVDVIIISDGNKIVNLTATVVPAFEGIECRFSPSSSSANFSSTLTIDVPPSARTSNYDVNITATTGGKSQSVIYNLEVLNAKVLVKGVIVWSANFSPSNWTINFIDTQTGEIFLGSKWFGENAYQVWLLNQHTYDVSIKYYYQDPVLAVLNFPPEWLTYNPDNYSVNAQVGIDEIHNNYTIG